MSNARELSQLPRGLDVDSSDNLIFSTGGTARGRVSSTGSWLLGTTTVVQSAALTVAGAISTDSITSHAGVGGAYKEAHP